MTTALIRYFTYFLALQKCKNSSDYSIHGLWIDYAKGGYPEFCHRTNFNSSELTPINNRLNDIWKSCWGGNEGLWEHEWKKHGTCFEQNYTLIEYFNKTLNLYDENYPFKQCNKQECLIQVSL